MSEKKEHSGNKYRKRLIAKMIEFNEDSQEATVEVDVYDLIVAFRVSCPGRQQAIKKILFAGQRGGKGTVQDLQEAIDAMNRAIQLEQTRGGVPSES